MSRFPKGDPALIRAIIGALHHPPLVSATDLALFSEKDWRRTEPWLDASGLALYFLHRIRQLEIDGAVPRDVVARLEGKRRENELRTSQMLIECGELNDAFQGARLRYANLKGFTLSPESCEAPALRVQSDYDFLIDPQHLEEAKSILLRRGYEQTGATARSSEFKRPGNRATSLELQYSSTCWRSVELHVAVEGSDAPGPHSSNDARLDRLGIWECEICVFPALRPEDNFIYQALHLLGHLRHELTKPSWLLEFRNHAMARSDDAGFWEKIRDRAHEHPGAALALGLSAVLARDLFGEGFPEHFAAWAIDQLPPRVALWARCYGVRSVLADVPGTKLYLFLEEAMSPDEVVSKRPRLLPRLMPIRMMARLTLRGLWFRLMFHWQQDAAYVRELPRWRRMLTLLPTAVAAAASDDTR